VKLDMNITPLSFTVQVALQTYLLKSGVLPHTISECF